MKHIPSVLSVQDFCSIGRCSLAATIPVLSTCGVQPVPLPTSLFSSTPFFDHYDYLDVEDTSHLFLKDWKLNNFKFDAIQTGFLASPTHVSIVKDAIEKFATDDSLIVIDPAMADDGKLYGHFKEETVLAMKELVKLADITTPNYTEALLITDRPYSKEALTLDEIKELCIDLATRGPKKVIITSVPTNNDILRTAVYDSEEKDFTIMDTPHIPVYVPGTGDIFTAIITSSTIHGLPLVEAVRYAVDFIYEAIKYTVDNKCDTGFGLLLEHVLPKLNPIAAAGKENFLKD